MLWTFACLQTNRWVHTPHRRHKSADQDGMYDKLVVHDVMPIELSAYIQILPSPIVCRYVKASVNSCRYQQSERSKRCTPNLRQRDEMLVKAIEGSTPVACLRFWKILGMSMLQGTCQECSSRHWRWGIVSIGQRICKWDYCDDWACVMWFMINGMNHVAHQQGLFRLYVSLREIWRGWREMQWLDDNISFCCV